MIIKTPDTCGDYYSCCDCGGENCGCAYCSSCHSCDYCKTGDGKHCEMISDEVFSALTDAQKKALAF